VYEERFRSLDIRRRTIATLDTIFAYGTEPDSSGEQVLHRPGDAYTRELLAAVAEVPRTTLG